jgi:hypothetical protein
MSVRIGPDPPSRNGNGESPPGRCVEKLARDAETPFSLHSSCFSDDLAKSMSTSSTGAFHDEDPMTQRQWKVG